MRSTEALSTEALSTEALSTEALSTRPDLRGLWVPVVTPLDGDGELDEAALARLCARLLADGVHGLVALGTTGEPATLTADERDRAVAVVAAACARGGRPLMVGAGTNATRTSIEAVRELAGVPGVAAALVVVPYYTRPPADAIVEHYRAVAAESPVPVVAYNVPYRTGRGLDAAHLLRLAEVPNVAGVKQAVGALDADTLAVLRDAPEHFHLLAGDDAYLAPTLLMGGAGAITAAAHVCTPVFVALVAAALAGDVVAARRLAHGLGPVVEAGFAEPNPAVWKAALHASGELATPALRAPMAAASPGATRRIVAAIAAAPGGGPGVAAPAVPAA